MNNIRALFLFVSLIPCVICSTESTTKLYLYGQPTFTLNSGFIKIDPTSGAWEESATGFATQVLPPSDAFIGVIFSNDGSALFYGNFLYWTDTYVGGILSMNSTTLNVSPFNSGILGNGVSGMAYYDNYRQVALTGAFMGVTQNPESLVGQVAACDTNGDTCRPLGTGLDSYFDEGRIVNIQNILYVLYMDSSSSARIAKFDASLDDSKEHWDTIYTTDCYKWGQSPIQITEYLGDLWIFGNVTIPDYSSVGAARWDKTSGSWDFIMTSQFPDSSEYLGTESRVVVSVSPNGQDVYMTYRDESTSNSGIYKWNNTLGDWTLFGVDMCPTDPTLAALDDGVLYGCAPSVKLFLGNDVTAGDALPGINCSVSWLSLTVQGDQLYAFCNEGVFMEIYSYNLSDQHTTKDFHVEDLETVENRLIGMCVYGNKIFIGGPFQRVGGVDADRAALWNSNYNRWTAFDMPIPTACWCGTDGNMMVAACTMKDPKKPPMLILDWASTDTGNGDFVQNVFVYNLTELNVTKYFSGVVVNNSVAYLGVFDSRQNASVYSWTPNGGLSKVLHVVGWPFDAFTVADSMLVLGSDGFMINGTEVDLAMYDINTQQWIIMDQLDSSEDNPFHIDDILFWSYTAEIYISGMFQWAGGMRVNNWVGYNTYGRAVDNVGGGMPNEVVQIQPIGQRMYLTTQENCPETILSSCSKLLYYDPTDGVYSYKITSGVGFITSGTETPPDDTSSSSNDSLLSHWWSWVVVAAGGVGLATCVAFSAFVISRKVWRSGHKKYQEISDILSIETAEIDFQNEPFELKSVLGRGSVGTVWSCVFPKQEAATYAVKQMLFSKGETKQIELVHKEIEILEKLRHPRIVHFCGYRMETSPTSVEFFVFMELYEKPCSLEGVIKKKMKEATKAGKRKWFTFEEVRKFMQQTAEGLEYLHSQGVAHRDLKCANLLVRTSSPTVVNSVHIADFGISKVVRSEEAGAVANTVLGTLSFMAPEIIRRQPYNPFKADSMILFKSISDCTVWSFAMLVYEILTWHAPELPGTKPEFEAEVQAYLNADGRFRGILDIFAECAQTNPDARPSAAELMMQCDHL